MTRPLALVTGASRGIGRRTAEVLATNGWDVAFTARTVVEGTGRVPGASVPGSLETTRALVEAAGARALPIEMDLLDRDSVVAAGQRVLEEWGGLDLLVNNAIVQLPGGHERVAVQDLDVAGQMVTGNYLHQLALIQTVLPAMVERGSGTIVNMASGSATSDPPAPPDEGGWSLAYAASKAAFGRVAGAVNAEFRSKGIRCFNVDPGFVITDAMRARGVAEQIEAQGFAGGADDAAGRVIAWLAADPAADRFLGKVIWSPTLAPRLLAAASDDAP
jgi:NAD(P)-dependent dehydrogenase (short-subunit alcohol dehydrogenase family)